MIGNFENLNLHSLSKIMGIPVQELLNISKIAPKLYYYKLVPKKSGNQRKLEIPHTNLKRIQTIILHEILDNLDTHPDLFGGPGTSTKKAAQAHIQKHLLITTDIKDFFPSVKSHSVRDMFLRHGASKEISGLLTRLVTHKNHLPQGSPASPAIGRLVLQPFAEELESILNKIPRAGFSIYVDDIILSGPKGTKGFLSTIRKMLLRYGLKINNKTKLMYRNQEQVCLNISVNDGIAPPASFLNELKELSKIYPPSHPKMRGKTSYAKWLRKS